MRYVRMWYIIPHTKTKRSRTHVHACTRADFFFGMYQLETRFARIFRVRVRFGVRVGVRVCTRNRIGLGGMCD